MKELRLKFTLHLYTLHSNLNHICYDEDDEIDEEFLNDRWNLLNNVHKILKTLTAGLKSESETSHWDPMFWECTYRDKDTKYVIDLITDPQTCLYDGKSNSTRTWIIHHLDLPDGSSIIKSRFDLDDYNKIKEAIKSEMH